MSLNQSRPDKNDQYKKTGRSGSSNQYKSLSGNQGSVKGHTGPSSSTSSLSSNRSFKNSNTNVQGGELGAVIPRPSHFSGVPQSVQNDAHGQPRMQGASNAPVASFDATQKSIIPDPKAPLPNSTASASNAMAPMTPEKGEGSKGYAFQFGTLSPSLMNGQIPARTNSAPPNLDEQKRDQAPKESSRAAPQVPIPIPSIPKQTLPRKDTSSVDQSNTHHLPKPKRETQVPYVAPMPQVPKAHTIPQMPIQMPFHQPSQVPIPFGGPNPHIQQPQGISVPLSMPMNISGGSQQMFIPGFQMHHMPSQPQGINYPTQMVPTRSPQIGSLGMNISPQYSLPQSGKFGTVTRKPVTIIDPKTNKEVKFANQSQSHPVSTFTPSHSDNYYTNPFNGGPVFPTSTQPNSNSLPPRFNPVSQAQQSGQYKTTSSVKIGPPGHGNFEVPPPTVQVTVKPPPSIVVKSEPHKLSKVNTLSNPTFFSVETKPISTVSSPNIVNTPSTCDVSIEFSSVVNHNENINKESFSRSNAIKDHQKQPAEKGHVQLPYQVLKHDASFKSGVSESFVAEQVQYPLECSELVLESSEPLTIYSTMPVSSNTYTDGPVPQNEHLKNATGEADEQEFSELVKSPEQDVNIGKQIEIDPVLDTVQISNEAGSSEIMHGELKEDDILINLSVSTLVVLDSLNTESSESTSKDELEGEENISVSQGLKDKPAPELGRLKCSAPKGKKKLKVMLQKKDALGSTSDLYMAYKGPEENKETVDFLENTEIPSSNNQVPVNVAEADIIPSKTEPDNWEDVADVSTLKLSETHVGEDVHGVMFKKYSRDFLLKFSDNYKSIPVDLDITVDIEPLLSANMAMTHHGDLYASSGRYIDRQNVSGYRSDRHVGGEDDKWNKQPGSFSSGRDMSGFRPGQGGSSGVLRNPRGHPQYSGGLLSGSTQSVGHQGGMQRNNPDTDRWQRTTGQQKGLFLSTHVPVMHKAENKYEVGKVTDEEEAKQRRLKAILNKLTPQNFEKLFEQVKEVNIDNAVTLSGIISQIFDKALTEPTFCEMYANFCSHLALELPDLSEDNEKITFKRLLLNKCQEEFERGEREQEEADRIEEGKIQLSEAEREDKRLKTRRRMLGNIRLIGELYKKGMLTERIMHECIQKLLGQDQTPDEEDIESFCKLMSTIGEMIDHPKAKGLIDGYFKRMSELSNNTNLSSRVRFMLKDAIDLRRNKWQQRRKIEGPKKIEEVHRDAAQERAQVSRMARGPSVNSSVRRPMEFSPRGLNFVPSPNTQIGGYRNLPTNARGGFGFQDARSDEKHSYGGRPLPVPLSHKSISDDLITFGPQGGLTKGMSIRGHTSISNTPSADIPHNSSDPRRMTHVLNGGYNSRENTVPSHTPDRFTHDQLHVQERNLSSVSGDMRNLDRNLDKSKEIDHLTLKSMTTIKEFYSAMDEKEVALCIEDLNSSGFYPTMISIWVTDSFERKDVERNLLTKLLVTLVKSRDGVNRSQLIKGFEEVLSTLEDALNDAPRAGVFMGHIFGRIILENVIPLREIGELIYKGGEVPGSLVEFGLADEVLGSTLEMIKSEKGDLVLNEILKISNLRLEDFRHPDPNKSRKLKMFI